MERLLTNLFSFVILFMICGNLISENPLEDFSIKINVSPNFHHSENGLVYFSLVALFCDINQGQKASNNCEMKQLVIGNPLALAPNEMGNIKLSDDGKAFLNDKSKEVLGMVISATHVWNKPDPDFGQPPHAKVQTQSSGRISQEVIDKAKAMGIILVNIDTNKIAPPTRVYVKVPGKKYVIETIRYFINNPNEKPITFGQNSDQNTFNFPNDFNFDQEISRQILVWDHKELLERMKAHEGQVRKAVFPKEIMNVEQLEKLAPEVLEKIANMTREQIIIPDYGQATLSSLLDTGPYKKFAASLVKIAAGVVFGVITGGAALKIVTNAIREGIPVIKGIVDLRSRGWLR